MLAASSLDFASMPAASAVALAMRMRASRSASVVISAALRFSTDETSYVKAGPAYLFERYLAAITRDFSGAPITLLDHRIAASGGQTIIDMRSFHALAPAQIPDEDIGEKEPGK